MIVFKIHSYALKCAIIFPQHLQVPFEYAVKQVLEQLRNIAKGDYTPPDTERKKFGTIVFAALSMPVTEILGALNKVRENSVLAISVC